MNNLLVLLVSLFKPKMYIIENSPFMGESVECINDYTIYNKNGILDTNGKFIEFSKLHLFQYKAKKELAKREIRYIDINNHNSDLARMLKERGFIRNHYEYIQVLEDGEASIPYQNYLEKIEQ